MFTCHASLWPKTMLMISVEFYINNYYYDQTCGSAINYTYVFNTVLILFLTEL